ncbi:MAG: hypothetical protein GX256_03120 [Fretibacterium sp.]|nr:hypothetical protein [Fretibacterium sp.]
MKKHLRFTVLCLLLAALTSPAWSAVPQDALSAPGEESVYALLNLKDAGGLARYLLSPANIELITPLLGEEEAQLLQMISTIAAGVPSQELALLAGTDAEQRPFLQLAVALPSEAQAKLDLVSSGQAGPEDIVTLLMGEGALSLAGGFAPEVQEASFGPFYSLDGQVAITARDNLMLFTLSPEELGRSVAALEEPEKRLALKRRYESRDFLYLHLDAATLFAIAKSQGANSSEEEVFDAIQAAFQAPLDLEFDFATLPDRTRLSMGANLKEALASEYLARLEEMPSIPGGHLHLKGKGRPLFAVGGRTAFRFSDLESTHPMAAAFLKEVVDLFSEIGVMEEDIEALLSDTLSFVVGGSATLQGVDIPGVYLAVNGKDGAAARILSKILEEKSFAESVPLAPLSLEGWDSLFSLDPALLPFPVVFGVKGEMLFLGIAEPTTFDDQPELTENVQALLEESSIGVGFLDFDAIWSWLKKEMDSDESLLVAMMGLEPPILEGIRTVLGARLSVPFLSFCTSSIETAFVDFVIAEVPEDERLIPRVIQVVKAFLGAQEGESE